MIVGHAAVAVAARARRPRLPFALLLVAAYLPDIIELLAPGLATGRRNENWSHALSVVVLLSMVTAALWWVARRSLTDAAVVGGVLLSHWVLDAVVSLKPIWVGGPLAGMLLYNRSVWAGAAAEFVVIAGAWAVMRRSDWSPALRRGTVAILICGEIAAAGTLTVRNERRFHAAHAARSERVHAHSPRGG